MSNENTEIPPYNQINFERLWKENKELTNIILKLSKDQNSRITKGFKSIEQSFNEIKNKFNF